MRHLRLIVEYDGTDLCGWQRQDGQPTVQQHLEEALARMFQHPVTVRGASRTDAGVHARGQVACFSTEKAIPVYGIRRGLNSLLPDAIAIVDVAEVEADFHPRFSASGKHYRYTILQRADRSPQWRRQAWHHPEALDLDAMRGGAVHVTGEQNFAAFRAAGCSAKTTIRRLERIAIARVGDLITFDIHGNAFLRNMVRILVGTLAEVGTGKRDPGQVAEIRDGMDRTKAGKTAPPQGLELVAVHYDGTRMKPIKPAPAV